MKTNKILLGLSALALTAVVAVPGLVKAYQGDPNVQGPNYSPERHETMTQAFENNDYNTWSQQMQGRGRVTQVVNESNFSQFAQMHQLMLKGRTQEANAIRAELGLGLQNGSGYQGGNGGSRGQNKGNCPYLND
jgi:hypothetical protein